MLVRPGDLGELAPDETMILCTGQPGRAALGDRCASPTATIRTSRSRMETRSSCRRSPCPGNELRVHDTINRLAKAGAEVLHQEIAPVHTSGHGNSEELRTMIALLRPRSVMPVHGEYRMLAAHARLARDAGVPAERIPIAENGSVVELSGSRRPNRRHVPAGITFVDGLAVGDVRDASLRDRRHLAEDGVLIVVDDDRAPERQRSGGTGGASRAASQIRTRSSTRHGRRRSRSSGGASQRVSAS